jgi:serine phosphatase RsbU (regulator of sigma subunit)/anti-sigma regulatory factor (Ser/Thr protein kinase)
MTMSERTAHRFAPQSASASAARRFVRETLTGWGADAVIDDAVLLTNELVTNAVVHAGTEVNVSCALGPDHVQIGVSDSHGSRALPPTVSNSDPDKTSGRGLFLISEIADSWGVEYDRSSKRVWFRLPLGPRLPEQRDRADQPTHFIELGERRTPVRVAVVETDPAGLIQHWSAEARKLLGWAEDDVLGKPLAGLVAAVGDGDATETFEEVLALPRWCGEYRVRDAQDRELPVFASQVHAHTGQGARVVTLLVPAEHRAVLMPGPTRTSSPDQEQPSAIPARPGLPLDTLLELAVEHSRDLLDGDAAYALLVTDDDLDVELRAMTGLDRAQAGATRWPKPDDLSGAPEAARPLIYDDVGGEEIPERFLAQLGMHGLVTAPLLVGERVIGRLGVAARGHDGFDDEDAERLRRSVERFSLAIENARLNEMERARRGRLSYLAEASDLLAGTLDPSMAAALTAQLVVPRLGDWCAVYLLDQRRQSKLDCVWHARESMIDPLRRLLSQVPAPPLDHSGRPQQWVKLTEYLVEHADSPAHVEVASGRTVAVTLLARGRPIGTLVAGRDAGREFRTGIIDTLDDLCRRAAWALDNARLYEERSAISDALQRSLLPARLPTVAQVDVGIAYEAAGEGLQVGGDFYDLFEIAEGRWGFAIGDVCGKGPGAAAVTGLARHSLRVLAREHADVPTVLRRLNSAILSDGEISRFVTLIYGEFSVEAGGIAVTFAAAGHPLPVLVGSNGSVEVVGRAQQLLGVFPDPVYWSDTLLVRPGQHLVCTTDGVTDRRVRSRTLGDGGLLNLLRQTAMLPAPAVAARLRQAVLDFGPDPLQDDFAVLVLEPKDPSWV